MRPKKKRYVQTRTYRWVLQRRTSLVLVRHFDAFRAVDGADRTPDTVGRFPRGHGDSREIAGIDVIAEESRRTVGHRRIDTARMEARRWYRSALVLPASANAGRPVWPNDCREAGVYDPSIRPTHPAQSRALATLLKNPLGNIRLMHAVCGTLVPPASSPVLISIPPWVRVARSRPSTFSDMAIVLEVPSVIAAKLLPCCPPM